MKFEIMALGEAEITVMIDGHVALYACDLELPFFQNVEMTAYDAEKQQKIGRPLAYKSTTIKI